MSAFDELREYVRRMTDPQVDLSPYVDQLEAAGVTWVGERPTGPLPTVYVVTTLGPGQAPAVVVTAEMAARGHHTFDRDVYRERPGAWGYDGSRRVNDQTFFFYDESHRFTAEDLRAAGWTAGWRP